MLVCAHGLEAAAALLAEPSQAAGVLDTVGDDGFSALLWAEERGLRSVAQKLRECGAADVRRPALSLFRGEPAKVQIKVAERTVAFNNGGGSYTTLSSTQRCTVGSKGYFELEILDISEYSRHQYGFASATFRRVLGCSQKRLGEDEQSWSVNPRGQNKWHDGERGNFDFGVSHKLEAGDVVGVACDLENMQMLISVNGGKLSNGVVFELAPDSVRDGLFAAFSGETGKVRYNLGEAPFKHAPPAADYQAFAAFEA